MVRITIREAKVGSVRDGMRDVHDQAKLSYTHARGWVFGVADPLSEGCGHEEDESQHGAGL
jgi:hypothetical protein